MTTNEVREKYLHFFEKRGHKIIPPAPLVLENDPTTLFTSSGMQPLVPYLMGEVHPQGKRVVDSQPSIRVQDIDEVGDNRHTTFFEMLGNWSFGDYFKEEQLEWIFQFLTNEKEGLGIKPEKLYVSVFGGEDGFSVNGRLNQLTVDFEAIRIWKELFKKKGIIAKEANPSNEAPDIKNGRIFSYGVDKNWWSRSGAPKQMPIGEIGGPDSEIFYDFGEERGFHEKSQWKDKPCHPNCDCGRFMEIGNSVFIQYKKTHDSGFEELPNKNVDFGGGLERLVAAKTNNPDVFEIDIFNKLKLGVSKAVEKIIELKVNPRFTKVTRVRVERIRIFLDHSRAVCFLLSYGVVPGKNGRDYVLRKLIRRADDQLTLLNLENRKFWQEVLIQYKNIYKQSYSANWNLTEMEKILFKELTLYGTILKGEDKVKKELEHLLESSPSISLASQAAGPIIFEYQSTYGIPWEISKKLANDVGMNTILVENSYEAFMEKHKDKSRRGSVGMFKGGLADHSDEVTRLHTATHLLHAALRQVLGEHVAQKGSNITHERLRFDYIHAEKLTENQKKGIEELVNEQVKKDLPVSFEVMTLDEAKKKGALAFFGEKYGERVKVYKIGDFSLEVCGGPHVSHLAELGGRVTIIKEEAVGAGVRRLYAKIEN